MHQLQPHLRQLQPPWQQVDVGLHRRHRSRQVLLLEAQPLAALNEEGGIHRRTAQQHLREAQQRTRNYCVFKHTLMQLLDLRGRARATQAGRSISN
jgi:hypothetical protein